MSRGEKECGGIQLRIKRKKREMLSVKELNIPQAITTHLRDRSPLACLFLHKEMTCDQGKLCIY